MGDGIPALPRQPRQSATWAPGWPRLGFPAVQVRAPPACGKPQQLNRIVGGEDSTDAEWPWVVSIQKNGTHHCAGTLLTSRWVVTAAHCFKGYPSQFSVLLGAWQLGNPGPRSQEVGIAWVQSHPVYSWKEGSRADIALVRLERSVHFSERVLPICLPDSSVRLSPNTRCWIAGWGSIRDAVPLPHPQTLQKLEVPIIDSEICSRLYWRGAGQGAITEDMLCAGYLEGRRDACLGDSGGPLMCQVEGTWLLAGIISWGEGCAERDRPGLCPGSPQARSCLRAFAPAPPLPADLHSCHHVTGPFTRAVFPPPPCFFLCSLFPRTFITI
uniref:tryptase n=1 Tax=Ursus maritimus TaxID=29073 RepID=A0A452SYG8_URSMA